MNIKKRFSSFRGSLFFEAIESPMNRNHHPSPPPPPEQTILIQYPVNFTVDLFSLMSRVLIREKSLELNLLKRKSSKNLSIRRFEKRRKEILLVNGFIVQNLTKIGTSVIAREFNYLIKKNQISGAARDLEETCNFSQRTDIDITFLCNRIKKKERIHSNVIYLINTSFRIDKIS